MEKPCKKCGSTEVYRVGVKQSRICKACQAERSRVWYEKNRDSIREKQVVYDAQHPEERRERWRRHKDKLRREGRLSLKNRRDTLWKMFRIRYEDYEEQLEDQGGACAICGNICKSGRRLAVDHEKKCCPGKKSCGKCLRGLLCMKCNNMLGHANDSIEILQNAIAYLQAYAERKRNVSPSPTRPGSSDHH